MYMYFRCLCFCVKSGSYHDFNVYIVNNTASFVLVIYLSEHFLNIVITILHTVTVYKQLIFTIQGISLYVTLKNMLHTFTINLCVLIFHSLASVCLKRPWICTHCAASFVAVKSNSGVAVPTTLGTCEGCSWSTG